jgi:hypothetical protein
VALDDAPRHLKPGPSLDARTHLAGEFRHCCALAELQGLDAHRAHVLGRWRRLAARRERKSHYEQGQDRGARHGWDT